MFREATVLACVWAAAGALGPVGAAELVRQRVARAQWTGSVDLLEARALETRARWDASSARVSPWEERVLEVRGDDEVVVHTRDGSAVFTDPEGRAGALAWWLPHRSELGQGTGGVFRLRVQSEGGEQPWRVQLRTLGSGTLVLPAGVREVVLQRALVERPGRVELVHRFVDPRAGLLLELVGPATGGGTERAAIAEATLVEVAAAEEALAKLYVDEVEDPPFAGITYGWDRGTGVSVADVIANNEGVSDMGDLIALDYWDFTVNTSGTEVAQTTVILNAQETCNLGQCGYVAGADLLRQDRAFDDPANRVTNNQVSERQDRATDVTIWLRAGAQKEGVTGCFGQGESRFCYTGTDSGGKQRKEVPLWRFAHQDARGWYLQPGDAWSSGTFQCEQNIFNTICGADPPAICLTPARMWVKNCSDKQGNQRGEVLKAGTVKLPSGHVLDAMLVRTVADFCVYSGSSCFFPLDQVRTVVYLWQVPHLGTVALLQSPQEVPADLTSFGTLDESNITFGLFPPESIAVREVTDTSITLWWDPGNDTHRVDSWRVYWDTDSGATSEYAFDSVSHAGQVSFSGTSATIAGLAPGTTYYLTVTARSTYIDPDSGVATTYESVRFPKQAQGSGGFVYPVEVRATTTGGACAPTEEVTQLTVDKVQGGIRLCWNAVSDPCLDTYEVLGAASPEAEGNFQAVAQTSSTCWTGDPAEAYYLVSTRGTGGTGPWGHFGR